MRERQTIEREIYRAREDLEENLAELKHVVQEKIDVKARARVAVAKGKIKAQEALETGKTKARELTARGKDGAADLYVKAKDRPALVGAIAGGVVAVGAIAYIGRRREWW